MDRRPKNSFENALFSKELAKPKPGHRWNARDPGHSCAARDGRLPDRWSCPGRTKQAQPGYEIELRVLFGPFLKYIRVQQKAGHPHGKIREIMSDKETGGRTPPQKLKQKRYSGPKQPGKSAETGGKPKAHPKEILETLYSIMRKPPSARRRDALKVCADRLYRALAMAPDRVAGGGGAGDGFAAGRRRSAGARRRPSRRSAR